MLENKPWESFIIFNIRHREDFEVVKIILCQLGYEYDNVELLDYKDCICFFPGYDENAEEFSVASAQEEQEIEEKGYLKACIANGRFKQIFNIQDFLKWYNENKLN